MVLELKSALRSESVLGLEPAPALTINVGATVEAALEKMRPVRAGCILAVDDGGKLRGIFTERDLVRKVLADAKSLSISVAEAMTGTLRTLRNDDTVLRAMELFASGGMRHLPVVDDAGKPVGVLSVKHIIRFLSQTCPEAVYCIPPDPERVSVEMYGG